MKEEDLIIGEIYYSNYSKSDWWIKYDGKNGNLKTAGYICNKTYNNISCKWGYFDQLKEGLRIATVYEKKWFNECAKQNKYIPLSETKFNTQYLIY